MKKGYVAISYANRKLFDNEIACLEELFEQKGIELVVFVDRYNFKADEEKEMMYTAFKEIDSCDFLIAELTTKSIGVGIEIGYAYAKQKTIIYLRKKEAEYSTTASGSSTHIIAYDTVSELQISMEKMIVELLKD